jgi:hypothetical protein
MVTFGATAWIPTIQAFAFFEIGPLVTGLLVAGRVGSGIGAVPTLFPPSAASSWYLDADEKSRSHTTATICCEHRYRLAVVRAEMRVRQGSLNPNHGNLFERIGSLKQRAIDSGVRGSLRHDQPDARLSSMRIVASAKTLMGAMISTCLAPNKTIRELYDR